MENIYVSESQAILLDLFSDEELAAKREANKDRPEVVAAIDAKLEAKAVAQAKAIAMEEFMALIPTLELPDAPEGVLNIYRAWGKVKRHLNKAERKELQTLHPDLTDQDLDNRLVETDQWGWGDWVINKAMTQGKVGSGAREVSTRKLAISVLKRDGTNLTPIGNFQTSKAACDYLDLTTGKDSARRVLEAHHFVIDTYEGADFLVKA